MIIHLDFVEREMKCIMPKLNKQQIKEMDEIIKNYKDRIVSRPIDLDEALKQNKKPE